MTGRDIDFRPLVPELLCRDVAASLAFYCGTLGFTKLYERDDPAFAYLEREGAQLMLDALVPGAWLTSAMEAPFGRGINLQIEASDLDTIESALAAAGHALFRETEEAWYAGADRLYGQRQLLVQDPDGYLLRFCQDLGERPLGDRPEGARTVA